MTYPSNTLIITPTNHMIVETAFPNKKVLDFTLSTYENAVVHSNCTITDDDTTAESEWESYTFLDMYNHFDCHDHAKNASKPLYTMDMWKRLMENLALVDQAEGVSFKLDETHLDKYYSGYTKSKGRGTYAMRNFTKGELVHDGTVSTLFWNDGLLWKEYVMSLPDYMACDVLEWTWIQDVKGHGNLLCLNLNDAALLNHDDDFNIAPKDNTLLEFYAVRGMYFLECSVLLRCHVNRFKNTSETRSSHSILFFPF